MADIARRHLLASGVALAGSAVLPASAWTRDAQALPSALDAAGQLQAVLKPSGDGFAWQPVAAGVQFRVGEITKGLIFYGAAMVRVCAHRGRNHTVQPSLAVVARPQALTLQGERRSVISLKTGIERCFSIGFPAEFPDQVGVGLSGESRKRSPCAVPSGPSVRRVACPTVARSRSSTECAS